MTSRIDTLRKTRVFLLNLIQELSVDQLNEIPPGFNNNIIWNIAHLIAAQQGVCYVRAGRKPAVGEAFFSTYKPETKPDKFIDAAEAAHIKNLFLAVLDQLESDYRSNMFSSYAPWVTRYGVELRNIDDALEFLPYHEGMHTGYVMALRRLVKK